MNFSKVLSTITGPLLSVVSSLIPGGPQVLSAINSFLPESKKLPITATGSDMYAAIANMTPDQRSSLMEKELDVEIARIESWTNIQQAHAVADSSGSSLRPFIALMMAWVVVFEITVIILFWGGAIYTNSNATLIILNDSWPMLLALVATPTALLRAYFGMRTQEKKARYSASSGQPVGVVNSILTAFKK